MIEAARLGIYIGADYRDAESGINRIAGQAERAMAETSQKTTGWANGVLASFKRISEVGLGMLAGGLLQRLAGGIASIGKEALDAVAGYERLGMSLQTLTARELRNASVVTETIKTGQTRLALSEKEATQLRDAILQRDSLSARLQEETERHRQLVAKWGEEGLAVKTHAASLAKLRADYEDVGGAIGKLEGKQGKLVDITQTNTKYTLSMADALDQGGEKAKGLIRWVELLAVQSPFSQDGVAQAFKMAMSYGFVSESADKGVVSAKRLTQAMIDYASGAGAEEQAMGSIARALGQIQAKGKLAGQEVMQLTEVGINVDQILAQAFGKSTAEIVKMREGGLIPADKAILAITESLERDFGGAAKRSTETFSGLISSLGDLKTIGLRELFTGIFDAVKPLGVELTNTLGSEAFIERLRGIGKTLGENIAGAMASIRSFVPGVIAGFQSFFGFIGRFVQFKDVLAALGVVVASIVLPALAGMLGAVIPIAAPILALVARVALLRTAWETNFGGIRDAVMPIITGIQQAFEQFSKSVGDDTLSGRLGTLGAMLAQTFGVAEGPALAFGNTIEQTINTVTAKVGELQGAFQAGGLPAVGQLLGQWGQELITTLQTNAPAWGQTIKTEIGKLWSNLTANVFPAIGEKLAEWWQTAMTFVQTNAPVWAEQVKQAIGQVWRSLTTFDTGGATGLTGFGQVVAQIEGFVAEAKVKLQPLIDFFVPTFERIGAAIGSLGPQFEALQPKFQPLIAEIMRLGQSLAPVGAAVGAVVVLIAKWMGEELAAIISHAGEILGGLIDVVTNVVGFVADLISGLVSIITKIVQGDWAGAWDAAKEMFSNLWEHVKGVVDGLLETIDGLAGTLWDTVTNLVGDLIGKNLPSWDVFKTGIVGMFERLKIGALEKLDSFVTTVKGIPKQITDFFAKLPEEFLKIGENLITSLADAISARANSYLRTVAQGVANLLPEWVKKILGIASPSTVFRDIGYNLMAGFGLGMQDGLSPVLDRVAQYMRLLVEKFAQLAGELNPGMVQSAKAVTDPIAATFQNIVMAIEAITQIAAFRDPGDLTAKMTAITETMKAVIQQLQELAAWAAGEGNTPETNLAYSAKAVTDPLAIVADNIARTLDMLERVAAYKAQVTVAAVIGIIDQLRLVVEKFDAFAGEQGLYDRLAGALGLASGLAQLASALGSIPEMLNALAGVKPIGDVSGLMTRFRADLGTVVDELFKASRDLAGFVDDEELRFVRDVGELTEGLTKAVNLLVLLQDLKRGAALEAVDDLMTMLRRILEALRDEIGKWSTEALELVGAFGSAAGSLMTGLQSAINVKLGGWTAPSADVWGTFTGWVMGIFATFYTWLQSKTASGALVYTTEGINLVATFAQALSNLMTGLKAAADLNISKWVVPSPASWNSFTSWVMGVFKAFYDWLQSKTADGALVYTTEGVSLAATFAQALSNLMGGLKAAADLNITRWTAPSPTSWTNFTNWVMGTFKTFYDWLQAKTASGALVYTTEGINLVATFGQALSNLMGGLKAAAELNISNWVKPAALDWSRFTTWIALAFQTFNNWIQFGGWDEDKLKAVADFGAAVSALMGGLKAAAELNITNWIAPASLQWSRFTTWIALTFQTFNNWIQFGGWNGDKLKAVADFGAAVSNLMGGLKAAAELNISNWVAPASMQWSGFTTWIALAFQTFNNWIFFGGWNSDKLKAVADFGAAVSNLMGGLKAAAELNITNWVAPSLDIWTKFTTWVKDTFTEFSNWVKGQFTTDELTLTSTWGQALTGLIGGLASAVGFKLSDSWTAPSPAVWSKFTIWIKAAFTEFSNWVKGQFTTDELTLTSTWGQALTGLIGGLASAVGFKLSDSWTAPSPAVWGKFTTWVKAVFTDFNTWVKGALTTESTTLVSGFGQAIQALFSGLQAALDFSQGFWFRTPNTTLWDGFKAWLLGTPAAPGLFLQLQNWVLANFPHSAAEAQTFGPIQAFSTALQAVISGLNAALQFFAQLADVNPGTYTPGSGISDFRDRIEALMSGIDTTLSAFTVWIVNRYGGGTGPWMETTGLFTTAVQNVMNVLRSALDIFGSLQGASLPSLAQIQAFVTAVLNLFGEFTSGLTGSASGTGIAVGQMAAQVLGMKDKLPADATIRDWGSNVGYQLTGGLNWYANYTGGTGMATQIYNAATTAGAWTTTYFGANSAFQTNAWMLGDVAGEKIVSGMQYGIDPATTNQSYLALLRGSIGNLTSYIEAQVKASLGIASPSKLIAGIFANVPAGAAAGILAGLPEVRRAAAELAVAAGPWLEGQQPSALAVTQTQRQEVVVRLEGDVSVGGQQLSRAQTDDIAEAILERLRKRT